MTRDFWKDGYTKGDFERLRQTLAAHLSEIMPGNGDEKEKVLNLIHDVQIAAADRANAILKAELVKIKWHGPNDGPITIEGMIALRDEDDGHPD